MISFEPWTYDDNGRQKDPVNLVSRTVSSSELVDALETVDPGGWHETRVAQRQNLQGGSTRKSQTLQVRKQWASHLFRERIHIRLWDLDPTLEGIGLPNGNAEGLSLACGVHHEHGVIHVWVFSFEGGEQFVADQLSRTSLLVRRDDVDLGNPNMNPYNDGKATRVETK